MSLTATVNSPATATGRRSGRIDALDWTKGALIICMVIYHAINYSAFRSIAFQFLAFLPPSFILITGFLVGQVYAVKYDLGTWKPYARLATRGFKLLAIFTILNFVHCVSIGGVGEFVSRARSIYLSGNGRAGIFEVLLPISYFLLLAPVLLRFRSMASGAIAVLALCVFLLCQGLEMNGKSIRNLDLLSIGIIGMALGLIPIQKIDRLAEKWLFILLLLVAYFAVSHVFDGSYFGQTLIGAIAVLILYGCALHLNLFRWQGRQMVLFGKYSLVGYIVQIAILQGIVKIFGGQPTYAAGVIALILATTVLTFLIIRVVHASRQRSRFIDIAYKTVIA